MKIIKGISIIALLLFAVSLRAQPPGWAVDPTDFEYSASFTWQFEFTSVKVMEDGDYLAAFVGDELRGSVSALLHPGFQEYYFPILVYSNTISGETVDFKYYDASNDRILDVELEAGQELTFSLDQSSGSFASPLSTVIDDLLSQEIVFDALDDKTFGDASFELEATGGASGNPVIFTSSDTDIVTINGTTVTIVGAGNVTITATQEGSDFFAAAVPVEQELMVLKAAQVIDFPFPEDRTFGDDPFTLDITGGDSGNPLELISSDESIATIDGVTVTIVGVGQISIIASQEGNDNYLDAVWVERNLTINKAAQTIDFSEIEEKVFGGAPFDLQATGGASGNALLFSSADESVAVVNGTTVTIIGAGTTTISAGQSGSSNYAGAEPVEQQLVVNKAPQTITFDPLPGKFFGDAPFDLEVTGVASGNDVTFTSSDETIATIEGTTVTIHGVGDISIIASQVGNDNYEDAVSVEQNLTVSKASQMIVFEPIATKTFGDDPFDLQATGGASDLPISFVSSDESVATVSGSTITIVGAGTTEITASQEGNDQYEPAMEVTQILVVNKADQTITLTPIEAKLIGDPAVQVTASVNTGFELTYDVSGPATITGNIITLEGTSGIVSVTVSQVGTENYNAASMTTTFEVIDPTKDDQQISFSAIADKTYGDAGFALNATASSGLEITYRIVSGSATIDEDIVTITGAGEVTVEAIQEGDDDYNTAISVEQSFMVSKANLEVTADYQSRPYGAVNPTLTLAISGFVNDEDVSVLNTSPVASTLATTSSGVDTYPIIAEGGADDNYEFTYISGELTIERAPLLITADDQAMIYGDSLPELTLTYSGFVNDEDTSVLDAPPAIITVGSKESDVGTYTIDLEGGADDNYSFELVAGQLTVSKAELTVSADDVSITYGMVIPAFTISYEGFRNIDDESAITPPEVRIAIPASTLTGTHPILLEGGNATNYNLTLKSGVLQITKANLIVEALSETITYGDALPEPRLLFTGLVLDDTESSLDVLPTARLEVMEDSNAGHYPIMITEGVSELYTFEYLPGTLVIEKAVATITVTDLGHQADGTPKLPTIVTDPEGLDFKVTYYGEEEPPTEPGEYTVAITITEVNYEGTLSLVLSIGTSTVTSVEPDLPTFSIYPNPANDWIKIDNLSEPSQIELMTIDGRSIRNFQTFELNPTLPLDGLGHGIYVLSIRGSSDSQPTVRKLIIK